MNQLLAMRAFVRVVETGSFSRASEQLNLPRSTVSKLVVDLETHLGIKLVQRTTRALATTADGLDYYTHAMRLLLELDDVDNGLRGRKLLKPHGHLRVDAPASFANCLLIPALMDFHQEYPDITLALGISDRAVNIVEEGVDCVIRAGKVEEMAMISRKIVDLEYITCAAPSYLQRKGAPRSPEDLEKNHFRTGYYFGTNTAEPLIFERGGQRYEVGGCAFSTNEGNGLKEMLLAGMGVGQHFKSIVQYYVDSGQLVPVLPEWSRPSMPLHIIYPTNRHTNVRLKAFINWVIRRFGVQG
ncbi:MAG: LysR substrate-binding domain-containing protein [Janthinobacterium lividum]